MFTGSQVGMMRELFTSKRRAFYAQARAIDLGQLAPADIAEFVDTPICGDRQARRGGARRRC